MTITKRRSLEASKLRDHMLLDFDDNEPSMISDVKHLAHKVMFMARGTQFCIDNDEILSVVTRMTLVEKQ